MTQVSGSLSKALRRRLMLTWCAMGGLLLPIAFCVYSLSPLLFDNFFYDTWLSRHVTPPSSDILIVAIDEPSLHALGRWPWSRDVHAKLIQRLDEADVKTIVLDVLLIEPSRFPEEDTLLAEAMRHNGNVYIPIALLSEHISEYGMRDILMPSSPLLAAAKGVGHINVSIDDDGTARSVNLVEMRRGETWPQLMALLVEKTHQDSKDVSFRRWPHNTVRIPFKGPEGTYPTVSYSDVLMGYVPASLLRDRTVLVGMTAAGLGDRYSVSLLPTGLMPGVEIHAHLLDALRDNSYIRNVESRVGAFLSVAPILFLMLLAWWFHFRYLLVIVIALGICVLLSSILALSFRWWWPPSASLITLGVAFVLIVWQSQSALLAWFKRGLEKLYQEPSILPFQEPTLPPGEGGKLQQQSRALEFALGRIVEGRRFILDAVNSLPLAIFVLNKQGEVLLANRKAQQVCWESNQRAISHIGDLPKILNFENENAFASFWPPRPKGTNEFTNVKVSGLCTDQQGRTYRLEMDELTTTANSVAGGWLIWMVDLTSEVDAEAQRSSMLSFLSHDMKAPQARALALLDAQKDPSSAMSQADFYEGLGQCLTTGLDMINDFISLNRARSFDLNKQFLLFEDVVIEVLDQVQPIAKMKKIKLLNDLQGDDGSPVIGDKSYLARAVFNVIENAVKYTHPYGSVSVRLYREGQSVVLIISDNGVGISAQNIDSIFDDYQRSDEGNVASGHGLGLALVKTVVTKHHGTVKCESELGKGSTFTLTLPACVD
ncbi:MAG: CHASE2 domain-containing protein [Pseudomonadota bacterium]